MNPFKIGDLVENTDEFNALFGSLAGELDECYKKIGEVIKVEEWYVTVWWPQLDKDKSYHYGNLKLLNKP